VISAAWNDLSVFGRVPTKLIVEAEVTAGARSIDPKVRQCLIEHEPPAG
jgi:hypothetical protein